MKERNLYCNVSQLSKDKLMTTKIVVRKKRNCKLKKKKLLTVYKLRVAAGITK